MKEGRPVRAALYVAPCVAACLAAAPAECGSSESGEPLGPDTTTVAPPQTLYGDVTGTHLPAGLLNGLSMDAGVADLDADGDLDIVIANEFRPNILLLNDGAGRFSDGSSRLPAANRDSEDVGIADFDGDGDLDIVVVSEDDRVNELYFNDGAGRFSDEGARLPVEGTTNGVVVADLNGDGFPDILFANNGQDAVVINDGTGNFVDETAERLPRAADVTQDLELGDVDGDGDLDLLFANVAAFVAGADPRNRLLINDGSGFFADETSARLPSATVSSFDGDLVDIDGDGDLDIVTANADVDLSVGRIANSRYRAYLNNGGGVFTDASDEVFGAGAVGTGLDLEFADLDGDGRPDFYLASRGTADRLLLRR
ncbi:MAG: VCBS repeat-containing protein [Gemmatimonadota bacterium]|nr:VCBS repeat-containing protein [Gemmatimonadota bacterium]MDE2864732.1 VCBS repeat-containing protein [Gemmatimonadota bacterium]